MNSVTVAATQMSCSWDLDANMAGAERLIRAAAGRGAQIVLIQELFETPYFCKDHSAQHFELARPLEGHPAVEHFRGLARELNVVLPVWVPLLIGYVHEPQVPELMWGGAVAAVLFGPVWAWI